MGRLSDFIGYVNEKKTPTARDIQFNYASLSITDEVKRIRYKYRLQLNEEAKQELTK